MFQYKFAKNHQHVSHYITRSSHPPCIYLVRAANLHIEEEPSAFLQQDIHIGHCWALMRHDVRAVTYKM